MKKSNLLLLIALLIILSCAAPKMIILLQEPIVSSKVVKGSYNKYDKNGNKTTDSLSFRRVELKPGGYFAEYDIIWLKFHPFKNIFLAQVLGESAGKKTYEISCVQMDNFQELWHLTLHQQGKISVKDVFFIDNESVIFINNQNEIVALALETGKELWRIEKPKAINSHYFPGTNKILMWNFGGFLTLVRTDTGDSVWTTKFGSAYPSEPILRNDELFIMSDGIRKYDLDEGLLWNNKFDTHYKISHTVSDIAVSVITSLLSGGTYAQTTPPDFYYGCFTLPLIFEDTLFFSSNGQIYAINNQSGEILWQTEKINDLDIINQMEIHGDNIYAKCGGYTLFLNGKDNTYSFKTRGLQGIIAFNLKTKEKLWFLNTFNESTEEAAIVRDFLVQPDQIIVTTEYEVIVLEKETGEVLTRIAAEDLRIGNIFSSKEIEQGLLVKGSQGISLLDKKTLDPLWSRMITSAVPKFCFIPSEKINLPFWKSPIITDLYFNIFYDCFFEFDSTKNLIFLVSEKDGLVGLNVADGSIRFEVPIKTEKFYFDFDKEIFVTIKNYAMDILELSQIFSAL